MFDDNRGIWTNLLVIFSKCKPASTKSQHSVSIIALEVLQFTTTNLKSEGLLGLLRHVESNTLGHGCLSAARHTSSLVGFKAANLINDTISNKRNSKIGGS